MKKFKGKREFIEVSEKKYFCYDLKKFKVAINDGAGLLNSTWTKTISLLHMFGILTKDECYILFRTTDRNELCRLISILDIEKSFYKFHHDYVFITSVEKFDHQLNVAKLVGNDKIFYSFRGIDVLE